MSFLEFKPWPSFRARKSSKVIRSWLRKVKDEATDVFKAGMTGSHTGRIYRRRGRTHQASAPDEYPATDTGRLLASLRGSSDLREAKVGTGMYYAKFLRQGTKKMARRRMSDNAIREGAAIARPSSRGWVAWLKTKSNR